MTSREAPDEGSSPTSTFSTWGRPRGYPRLAEILDVDESFMKYRRFARLHLKYLQDILAELEQQSLQGVNENGDRGAFRREILRAKDDISAQSSHCLLQKITGKLRRYGK